MPLKFEFISESQHIVTLSDRDFSDKELWRVIGIPREVPVGKSFKVTLEELQKDLPKDPGER
jgi:hypothetical protein